MMITLLCTLAASCSALHRCTLPQFILLTHDDAISDASHELLRAVLDSAPSVNGCPVVFTLFINTGNQFNRLAYTGYLLCDGRPGPELCQTAGPPDNPGFPEDGVANSCTHAKDLYDRGCEVADHTHNHTPIDLLDREQLTAELSTMRQNISACGIPASDVVGFRPPYLRGASPVLREVLHELGFLYSSRWAGWHLQTRLFHVLLGRRELSIYNCAMRACSLIECSTGSASQGFARRLWPFDMGEGIPISCGCGGVESHVCNDEERHPGLFEVPGMPGGSCFPRHGRFAHGLSNCVWVCCAVRSVVK